MKAKLIKIDPHYFLIVDCKTFGSTMEPHLSASIRHALSLKNCQAIENGYDLDELVKERFGEAFWHDGDKYFKEGFQKALEILGDKRFSESDMRKVYDMSCGLIGLGHLSDPTENNQRFTSLFQSLQQTEWDVEIEMEMYDDPDFVKDLNKEMRLTPKILHRPKLDADGCLILRKI
jgi:hypothetical protein